MIFWRVSEVLLKMVFYLDLRLLKRLTVFKDHDVPIRAPSWIHLLRNNMTVFGVLLPNLQLPSANSFSLLINESTCNYCKASLPRNSGYIHIYINDSISVRDESGSRDTFTGTKTIHPNVVRQAFLDFVSYRESFVVVEAFGKPPRVATVQ